MKKEEMFSRLVENAFDFLFKAIAEIKEQPKHSIIHFYAAVELLVKARFSRSQPPRWECRLTYTLPSWSLGAR